MTLTFITEAPCGLCGYRNRGVMIYSRCVVNKHSLRTGPGFGSVTSSRCRECGDRSAAASAILATYTLDAKSVAKVRTHRERRGWAS